MIYELYCCGHVKKFKTKDGYIKRSIHFCSGCRKRTICKFCKNHEVSKVICELDPSSKDSVYL